MYETKKGQRSNDYRSSPSFFSFDRALERIEQTDPDVVVGCLFYASCHELIVLAEQKKIRMRNSLFTHCTSDPRWARDMIVDDPKKRGRYVIGQSVWDPRVPQNPAFFGRAEHLCVNQSCLTPHEFQNVFSERFGELPPYQAAFHFSGIETLFWSIRLAQSTATDDVRFKHDSNGGMVRLWTIISSFKQIKRALRSNIFPTVAGPIEFSQRHRSRSASHLFIQYQNDDALHIVSPDFHSTKRVILVC